MSFSVQVSVPLTSTGVLAVNLPCSEYKVVERGVANQGVVPKHVGGDKSDVLNGKRPLYTLHCLYASFRLC